MRTTYLNRDTVRTISLDIIDEANILASRRKEPVWDKENSALIVLDMQDYFLNYNSHAYIPASPSIIDNVNNLIVEFSKNGLPVVLTKHTNSPKNSGLMQSWWKNMVGSDDMMSGISPQIIKPDDAIIIEKHKYDAFEDTKLESILSKKNITNLVITGVMTNLCCETSARSAFMKGFTNRLIVDATAAYNYEYQRASCINLALGFSLLAMTEDIIGGLVNS